MRISVPQFRYREASVKSPSQRGKQMKALGLRLNMCADDLGLERSPLMRPATTWGVGMTDAPGCRHLTNRFCPGRMYPSSPAPATPFTHKQCWAAVWGWPALGCPLLPFGASCQMARGIGDEG